ncbi:SIR2 family protein [Halovenus salina]|uniref:SIR2 family protein n=1 Tax=Halovenus salina TaxID=1510225 RepID=A0ABD5VXA2_9EURY|nr:SIR2 family protein [Halovenus salina]
MQRKYENYKTEIQNRIEQTISELNTQPVLFIGTGLSIRYFGAPSWEGLLREMAESDAVVRDFEYYQQTLDSEEEIGEEFAELYKEWAWPEDSSDERDEFPSWLYDPENETDIFLKYSIAEYLKSLIPDSVSELSERDMNEIKLLEEIQPHAVITTNYDTFLEDFVYTDYEKVIGQTLIREPFANIGEIFKIHGCTSDPSNLVLTSSDYEEFDSEKAYLSAKLLTFFTEHPVLIAGYRPNDPNVKRILSDVNSVLSNTDRQANIFLLKYKEDVPEKGDFNKETLIDVGDGEQMVVNHIIADDFDWVFESFTKGGEVKGVNIKLLRKLLNNTYDIIQEEAPRREIAVDTLESVADDKEELLDILGIAPVGEDTPSAERSPSSISEAGVPIGKIIRNDDVSDLQDLLDDAVESWEDYRVLIEDREAIYPFYNQRKDLELTNIQIEFLFESSITNIVQGSEWLIRYDGDIDDLLSDKLEILDGRSIAALERNLLALGKEEKLREISETQIAESALSSAEEYASLCDSSAEERIKAYTGDVVRYDDNYEVDNLLSGSTDVIDLLDDIIKTLIEDDDSSHRTALRKVELIRIVNSPLCG